MKKMIKWGAISIGALIVLVIASLLIVPRFVDVKKYKPLIEKKVQSVKDRRFDEQEKFRSEFQPVLERFKDLATLGALVFVNRHSPDTSCLTLTDGRNIRAGQAQVKRDKGDSSGDKVHRNAFGNHPCPMCTLKEHSHRPPSFITVI